jgi:GNAT superfamily N-acetyltransferase
MTRDELDLAVEWAAQEGWNPGLADADCFYAADPQGFQIGYLGEEPVGCISVVRYHDSFGFLGFYIVRPEQRGRGFGYRLGKQVCSALRAAQSGWTASCPSRTTTGGQGSFSPTETSGLVGHLNASDRAIQGLSLPALL